MSYQTLVDSNLNRAFNLVKDLAQPITFVRKPDPAFDFGTGEATFSADQNISTKAVIYNSKKKSKDKNSTVKEVLLKSKEIGDASLYDKLLINNETWSVTEVIKNDGFISVIEIAKET